jgi:hypothetical protein
MHTWKTNDGSQNCWETVIPQKIDYLEHTLLSPDKYQIDNEDEFLETVNMDRYFYKDIWETLGTSGEWLPGMVKNHVCMLESQKRGFSMVKNAILEGDKFKFVMFIRPDITIHNELPIYAIITNYNKIHIPNHGSYAGVNDQFAIIQYEFAHLYGNRIDELEDFRKNQGRIVGEEYCKFIINKYKMVINKINFKYSITRP